MAATIRLLQSAKSLNILVVFSSLCAVLALLLWPLRGPVDLGGAPWRPKTVCESPQYTVRTISFDPLIQHTENFITSDEIRHIINLSKATFEPSTTIFSNGTKLTSDYRTSSTSIIPFTSSVSQCIIARAAEYQGYADLDMMEELQITHYRRGQHYGPHYDWLQSRSNPRPLGVATTDRQTTFFVTLQANCTDCGTQFPRLSIDWDREDLRWCRFVECDVKDSLVVKPIIGSALFWTNLYANGTGDRRMLHAGLPVKEGWKTGLNIWTRRGI